MNLSALSPFIHPPTVPIDEEAFKDLAQWELSGVLATANHTFFGLHMSQHPQAVVKLNQLLNATRPARIVEIGTGNAGLTVLFALYCKLGETPCVLRSYDKTRFRHTDLLDQLDPQAFRQGDALEDPVVIDEVKALVAAPGRTLLIADCGKALEFNLYVPHLKVGDIAMMHDFAPDLATFERDIKGKVWNWCESWYDRVAETCKEHHIVHSPYFYDTVWSCGIKVK